MKYARIENNTVCELIDFEPEGKFHSSLIWVACDEGIQEGWIYDGEYFTDRQIETEGEPA